MIFDFLVSKLLHIKKHAMDQLYDKGWADGDILDAVAHGANMVASRILMKTFKVDQTC